MENRIKERLTGALILVVLVVILVPELLSGRASRGSSSDVPAARPATEGPPLRSYSMDLAAKPDMPAGQAALNVRPAQESVPLPAPAALPEPEPAKPAPPQPAAKPAAPAPLAAAPVPAREAAAKTPVAAEKPVAQAVTPKRKEPPAPPPGGKGWSVQVGSFAQREHAERYAQQLARKGYKAHVLGGGALFRVRVGPVSDRGAAVALQAKLAAAGYRGSIAAP